MSKRNKKASIGSRIVSGAKKAMVPVAKAGLMVGLGLALGHQFMVKPYAKEQAALRAQGYANSMDLAARAFVGGCIAAANTNPFGGQVVAAECVEAMEKIKEDITKQIPEDKLYAKWGPNGPAELKK